VTEREGELELERVAIGEHILLGGDNIDLALARSIEHQLAAKNVRLDTLQLHALWQNCRIGKEKLLEEGNDASDYPVTVLGKGTGVVGGTIRAKLQRADLERILRDGFFPVVSSQEMPQGARRAGLQELGLPYAADAAVTRHMARFLRQHASAAQHSSVRRGPSGLACPTHVLFNGGVLRAQLIRERLVSTLDAWLKEEGMPAVLPLTGEDLMHAVARGAATYGLARQGRGVRIRGGVARTYYVGIESAMPAVPGVPAPVKALTVVPFGMEESTGARIPDREFGLAIGQPAEFRFFSSTARKDDAVGAMIEDLREELEELAPVEVTLPAEGANAGEVVPVSLETEVTGTGLLQLWCVARDGRRWKLEFNVRERVSAA
jgi:molecular chaperone DnaK (HSP70)